MKSPLRPKKNLGQNFLTDTRIQQKIIEACSLCLKDTVVEIGPGQGVLTRLIAPKVQKLICVEADRDLIEPLRAQFVQKNVGIVHADFLKWPMNALPRSIKVIGNIPYYISTPIIEKLIEHRSQMTSAFLTVQLEFGQRLAAGAGSKNYGSLSCFAQYHADVRVLFKIKNTCFNPKPKVDSCFVRLDMRKEPLCKPRSEGMLFKVVHHAFGQRRKMIVNSLSILAGKRKIQEALERLGIDPKARAEELNLDSFLQIADALWAC